MWARWGLGSWSVSLSLVLIQIIFSTINLVPILLYHLTNRTFFYSYQRQLIYPTLAFTKHERARGRCALVGSKA